jgi:Transposase
VWRLPSGLTLCKPDALVAVFGSIRRPDGRRRCTRTAGRGDLIGTCARGAHHWPVPTDPDRCVPDLNLRREEVRHDQHGANGGLRHWRCGHPRPHASRSRPRLPGAPARWPRVPDLTSGVSSPAGVDEWAWRFLIGLVSRAPAATGVALARYFRGAGVLSVEVDRPDRPAGRARGKSDPLDAYSAARAALSGAASVVPKVRDGKVEAIRAIRVARSSAVKARSQATNQIKALLVTGPAQLRQRLRHLSTPMIIASSHDSTPVMSSATPTRQPRPPSAGCPASPAAVGGDRRSRPRP